MYTKTKEYTLEELIEIFVQERKSLRDYFISKTGLIECTTYLFDLWIEKARECKTEEEFDSLIHESLRMSFVEWLSGL